MLAVACFAQELPLGLFREFSVPEYYDPPHETQVKSLLQGDEALPQDQGRILIKKLTLKTFREDGAGEFVMNAVNCLYDTRARKAASAGPLRIETADGRFSTEGEGFLWQERESVLTISNRVHTVIRTDRVNPADS